MNTSINVSLSHAGKCLNSFESEWKKITISRLSFDSDDKNADLKVNQSEPKIYISLKSHYDIVSSNIKMESENFNNEYADLYHSPNILISLFG